LDLARNVWAADYCKKEVFVELMVTVQERFLMLRKLLKRGSTETEIWVKNLTFPQKFLVALLSQMSVNRETCYKARYLSLGSLQDTLLFKFEIQETMSTNWSELKGVKSDKL